MDTFEFEVKLNDWLKEVMTFELEHQYQAVRLTKRAQVLGIPVIVLSAIIGTAAFTSLLDNPQADPIIKIFIGVLSVLTAIFTALQSNMNWAEKAAKHKVAADGFGLMKDELHIIRDSQDEDRLDKFFDTYRNQKPTLLKDTGLIDSDIRDKVEEEVASELERYEQNRKHVEAWNPYKERDRVYDDVAGILQRFDEMGEDTKNFAFLMRKELNLIHLNRTPVLMVPEAKNMLKKLKFYQPPQDEVVNFDDCISPEFVEAIMNFQCNQELKQIDGIAGPYTKKRLRKLSEEA